jgi:hypothetical protein
MTEPHAPLRLPPDLHARIDAAAAEQGLSAEQWIERLVLRETDHRRSTIADLESRRVGAEDEARGGLEAPASPANPTDD